MLLKQYTEENIRDLAIVFISHDLLSDCKNNDFQIEVDEFYK